MNTSRNPHIPSCVECRTRKVKCSKERPSCAQCRSSLKQCTYTSKITRTPLTRKYLSSVEQQRNRFQNALQRLFPTGNVEEIVQSLAEDQSGPFANLDASRDGATRVDDLDLDGILISESPTHQFPGPSPIPPAQACQNTSQDTYYRDLLQASVSNEPFLRMQIPECDDTLGFATQKDALDLSLGKELRDGVQEQEDTDRFVNAFFTNYHPAHPFVHETTFRARFTNPTLDTYSLSWKILFKAVMAVGAWSIGDVSSTVDLEFYTEAKELLQGIGLMETGNTTLLQGLLLLHDFAMKREMPNTSLQYLAVAVRMAVNLGLHREDPHSSLTVFEREMRRRIWWSIYVFDSGAAKTFGLPLLLPENSFMTTRTVLNIHEEALHPESTSFLPEVDGPTLYTGLIAQSQFHPMANGVYRSLISKPNISVSEVQEQEKVIDGWRDSCPYYLQQSDLTSHSMWLQLARDRVWICDKNLRLLLWRPFLFSWAAGNTSREDVTDGVDRKLALRCLQTARDSMALIRGSIENTRYPRVGTSFLLYCVFHALLIHVVYMKSKSPLPDSTCVLEDVRAIKHTLSESRLGNDAQASHFLEVINRLCMSFDAPVDLTSTQEI